MGARFGQETALSFIDLACVWTTKITSIRKSVDVWTAGRGGVQFYRTILIFVFDLIQTTKPLGKILSS